MDSIRSSTNAENKSLSLSFMAKVYTGVVGPRLHRTNLWRDIKRFGGWLESDGAALADRTREDTILVELDPDRAGPTVKIGAKKYYDLLNDCQGLWNFLLSLGIERARFDCRLESNQVADVMTLLYSYRRKLLKRHDGAIPGGVVGRLLGENGLYTACACVSIRGETLTVSYTHCALAFSRLVRWFERKHRNFHDHRALFHAAPRYAILVLAVAIGPTIVYTRVYGDWPQLVISTLTALLFAALVYVFFMLAGSVEYENEEKDYQLNKAYYGVKTYAQHIKADLRDAQAIQRKFLPDLTDSQLSEHIDWAVSFAPVEEVGGDYYDVQALDDNRIAILFGDVSGHGLAAAFITGILKTTFASWPESQMTLTEFMSLLNSILHKLTPVGSFAAVFVGVYDRSTGELSYVNGGHYPQPLRVPEAEEEPISSVTGGGTLLLGVDLDIRIEPSRLALEPGDVVLFVSDAVVENRNIEGQLYGTERLSDLLQAQRGESVQDLVASIVNDGRAFSKETKQVDDMTVLALQIKKGLETEARELQAAAAQA
ncbi:MAG: PP2C family protein-serine/threonine phosphatase [Planctomycetota bacterium]